MTLTEQRAVNAMRPVRSFVRREGRLTTAQQRAFNDLWPRYGIADLQQLRQPDELCPQATQCIVEIGFGNGESLAMMAARQPDHHFIGVEVHRPGIGHLLLAIEKQQLANIHIVEGDAASIVGEWLPEQCADRVQIYFPDPWPKKRHHKRRLIQPAFVAAICRCLKPRGVFHLATDWQPYAEHMLEVLRHCPLLENTVTDFAQRPDYRPITKFEQRGQRLGHGIYDLLFYRCE